MNPITRQNKQQLLTELSNRNATIRHLEGRCVKLGVEIEQNRIDTKRKDDEIRRLNNDLQWVKQMAQSLTDIATKRARVI